MQDMRKINAQNFRIENNIICFNETMIQISNISLVSVEPVPAPKFNWLSIVCAVAAVFFMQMNGVVQFLGVPFIVLFIVYIVDFISKRSDSNSNYLNIFLNSGISFHIICWNAGFLRTVLTVIEYCINNHSTQNIQIDFNRCQLINSPVIAGNGGEVH